MFDIVAHICKWYLNEDKMIELIFDFGNIFSFTNTNYVCRHVNSHRGNTQNKINVEMAENKKDNITLFILVS